MKKIIIVLGIGLWQLTAFPQEIRVNQLRSENFNKLKTGMTFEEIVSILLFEEEINKTYLGGIFVGIGLFPKDSNSINTYTGIVNLHEYQLNLENSKLKECRINWDKFGSETFNGEYIYKGLLGDTKNNWSLVNGKFDIKVITIDQINLEASIKRSILSSIQWVDINSESMVNAGSSEEEEKAKIVPPKNGNRSQGFRAFKISKYEVTFEQYDKYCEAIGIEKPNDDGWGRGNHPVIHVSWLDALNFAEWLGCRLPTETEWECACHAGTTTPFNTGDSLLITQANYNGNFPNNNKPESSNLDKTVTVGSYAPNAWGLYDMHGNVSEWCSDSLDWNFNNSRVDKSSSYSFRIYRGGNWKSEVQKCQCSTRNNLNPPGNIMRFENYAGIRLVSDN
jgi:sulfatase modifying factor 1